jgi:hypothetical protein
MVVGAGVENVLVAMTVTLAAGITRVVTGDVEFATGAPVHSWKTWPTRAALAVIVTVALAAKDPPPEPLMTASAYWMTGGAEVP